MFKHSRHFRFQSILVILCLASLCPARSVLKSVPADALFCVQIRNIEYTLGTLDQFLSGLSPMPVAASITSRIQLANALGDPNLSDVNLKGELAIFAVGSSGDPNNISVAALLPVTDYSRFSTDNPTFSKPDANGISKVGPRGLLVTEAGDFALITEPRAYQKLIQIKKSADANHLSSVITKQQTAHFGKSGLWVYANLAQVMKLYGPRINSAIDRIAAQKRFTPEANSVEAMQARQFIQIYKDILKSALNQTGTVAVTFNFSPEVINVAKTVTALPGTAMEKIFVESPSKKGINSLAGYLPESQVLTMADNINKPMLISLYSAMLDELAKTSVADTNAAAEKKKIMDTVNSILNSMGDGWAATWLPNPDQTPPFTSVSLIAVSDPAVYRAKILEGKQLISSPLFQRFFKITNSKIDYDLKQNAQVYKGIPIDILTLKIETSDPNTRKAVSKLYGSAFVQKFAIVQKTGITTAGLDANSVMEKTIDKVLSAKMQLAPEFKNSVALIPDANDAQFVGTFNYLRLLQVFSSFTPMPFFSKDILAQVPTSSNFAFAGRCENGIMTFEIAIPKKHLTEIKSVIEMSMQQRREEMQKKHYSIPESNSQSRQ